MLVFMAMSMVNLWLPISLQLRVELQTPDQGAGELARLLVAPRFAGPHVIPVPEDADIAGRVLETVHLLDTVIWAT